VDECVTGRDTTPLRTGAMTQSRSFRNWYRRAGCGVRGVHGTREAHEILQPNQPHGLMMARVRVALASQHGPARVPT